MMRFSLKNGNIPIITTKKTAWKTCLKEFIWFIEGQTDNYFLNEQGVHIWDGNASKEFLDSRGLNNYHEGILGPIYGFQWRNFNGHYDICNCKPFKNCCCNDTIKYPLVYNVAGTIAGGVGGFFKGGLLGFLWPISIPIAY